MIFLRVLILANQLFKKLRLSKKLNWLDNLWCEKIKLLGVIMVLQICFSTLCSPLGSSVCGILQARILEWVAIPFSRGSPQPRDQTQFSWTAGRFFTICTSREPPPTPAYLLQIHKNIYTLKWYDVWDLAQNYPYCR